MCHDTGQLTFVIRRLDGANVDVNGTPRKSEGVDLLDVHYMKTERPFNLARRVDRQLLPELLHIL